MIKVPFLIPHHIEHDISAIFMHSILTQKGIVPTLLCYSTIGKWSRDSETCARVNLLSASLKMGFETVVMIDRDVILVNPAVVSMAIGELNAMEPVVSLHLRIDGCKTSDNHYDLGATVINLKQLPDVISMDSDDEYMCCCSRFSKLVGGRQAWFNEYKAGYKNG